MATSTNASTLTAAQARAALDYNPDTGALVWKRRNAPACWNTKFAGKPAGYVNSSGYVMLGLRGHGPKWMFFAHRLAWLIYYGEWPPGVVDHINGDRTDNRIANLRVVTVRENTWNARKTTAAQSGVRGVSQVRGRWYARITRHWRTIQLGSFATKDEAVMARRAAEYSPWPDVSRKPRAITA